MKTRLASGLFLNWLSKESKRVCEHAVLSACVHVCVSSFPTSFGPISVKLQSVLSKVILVLQVL